MTGGVAVALQVANRKGDFQGSVSHMCFDIFCLLIGFLLTEEDRKKQREQTHTIVKPKTYVCEMYIHSLSEIFFC